MGEEVGWVGEWVSGEVGGWVKRWVGWFHLLF